MKSLLMIAKRVALPLKCALLNLMGEGEEECKCPDCAAWWKLCARWLLGCLMAYLVFYKPLTGNAISLEIVGYALAVLFLFAVFYAAAKDQPKR